MKKSMGGVFFPILINVQNFPCLVVGGGNIATRKVESLLEFNADITVISPKLSKSLQDLFKKGKIKLIQKSYAKEFISEFKIVFCATDNNSINKTVHKDCQAQGIPINVADIPQLCDFILPAYIKRGDLTISVSSQGKAPFYTKEMKKKLNRIIPPIYEDILNLAGEFREQVLLKISAYGKSKTNLKLGRIKSRMFKEFVNVNWEKYIMENGIKQSRNYMLKIIKELSIK
jgi:precorrin-2 dehydrogenase/sirohydrochlorin ferrochelatase